MKTCTIVGAGLAGTWLAWWLAQYDQQVTILDDGAEDSASRVAAGLINPITGPRYQATWQGATLLPWMVEAYRAVERATGAMILRQKRLWRVIRDAESLRRINQRVTEGEYTWMDFHLVEPGCYDDIQMPYGAVNVLAYTVDTNAFINAVMQWLPKNNGTIERRMVDADCGTTDATVWATGWRAARDPRWQWLPFAPVRGDILDVTIPDLQLQHILTGRVWLVPYGQEQYRLGATYDWDQLDTQPKPSFRDELLQSAQDLLGHRPIVVHQHRVGIRPAVLPRRPIVGQHPREPNHFIVNGLGTKGASLAPWTTHALTQYLTRGTALPAEIDIAQYSYPTHA
jgi:glycine/D-amino acid oxidase-like deaminating enzyme